MTMEIQIQIQNGAICPEYKTEFSAGCDLHAFIEEPVQLGPMERKLITTGISVAIPEGYEGQVRPRSGLALKHGITVLNKPGTIDADYRGDVGVIVINLGQEHFVVNNGDRIAQLVIAKHDVAQWQHVSVLPESVRGTGGFGST